MDTRHRPLQGRCPANPQTYHFKASRVRVPMTLWCGSDLFLVACTRLYKTLCRSVGWSVGRSHFAFFAFLSILKIEKFISKYLISFKTYLGSLLCHSLSFFVIFCHDDTLSFFVFFDHLESFWLFFSSFNYVSITCLIFNHLLCHFLSFSVIFCHFSSFIS